MTSIENEKALIDRSSNFTISLLSSEESSANERTSHEVHRTILRPLLNMADECWAYGIEKDSEIWRAGSEILSKEKGKFRINTSGDPITGREFFWNAHSGKRGTIVIAVPLSNFSPDKIFKQCRGVWVFDNYRAGHTPAAIKFAQNKIGDQSHIVFCLPRNNGIEWVEVFAPKPIVFDLYDRALHLCSSKR